MKISSELIKELRRKTQASIVECKEVLIQTNGNLQEAEKILQAKGKKVYRVKEQRETKEGLIASYIHHMGNIGVLVEVLCETDFVSRCEEFKNLAKDLAMHIAAFAPKYIKKEDISQQEIEEKLNEFEEIGIKSGKSPDIAKKIAQNKLQVYFKEVCLLEQPFIKDENITVSEYIATYINKFRENIKVNRFVRFELGKEN